MQQKECSDAVLVALFTNHHQFLIAVVNRLIVLCDKYAVVKNLTLKLNDTRHAVWTRY